MTETRKENALIEASAPCRIDMGGTLDIKTFHLPLRQLGPCTVNAALNLRTNVRIFPYHKGDVKVSSTGFESVSYKLDSAPFDHSLGLMFAIAAYFNASGIHIDIESSSPPRSALGGSSSASVALVAALSRLFQKDNAKPMSILQIVVLAHAIEESVAGVPCGFQDQLAAAYGGVNVWYWENTMNQNGFLKKKLVPKSRSNDFSRHILLAYCGIPHESKNINGQWVSQFIEGSTRKKWASIIHHTHLFSEYLLTRQYQNAGKIMNQETAIRRQMTPDVLDETGTQLFQAAKDHDCGARFTGAGGGGCIWAIGEIKGINRLREVWKTITAERSGASLLDVSIDENGLIVKTPLNNRGKQ